MVHTGKEPELPPPNDVRTSVHFEDLHYSNPWLQIVHPRWADGKVVWSIPCGPTDVDPEKRPVAKEDVLSSGSAVVHTEKVTNCPSFRLA